MRDDLIGHNNPPAYDVEKGEALEARISAYYAEIEELPRDITTDTQSGQMTDAIQKGKSLREAIKEFHKDEKEPHLTAGRACDAFKNKLFDPLTLAIGALEQTQTTWLKARKAAAEKQVLAAGGVPENVKPRATSLSGVGRAMTLRTTRRAEISNLSAANRHYRERPEVQNTILKLANADIRAAKGGPVSIPGIEVIEEEKAQ